MMRRRIIAMVIALLTAQALDSAYAQNPAPEVVTANPTVRELLEASDKVINPPRPFRMTDTLVEYVSGHPRDRLAFLVYVKEDSGSQRFRNLVRWIDPPRDAGKLLLLDGTHLWFYDPAARTSIRISPQQRAIGQAADGDVVTVNLALDYTGKVVGRESIPDADNQSRDCWHLDMTATTEGAIYGRVEYWIDQGNYQPVKAKYYADSGQILKIAYFRKYAERLGGMRPTEIVIIDALDPDHVTTITFADGQFMDIPDAWFQREFLPRLRVD